MAPQVIEIPQNGLGNGAPRPWSPGKEHVENKQFCETTSFAPPMISMTYGRIAKPFVSLSEMNPLAFAGFPPRPFASSGHAGRDPSPAMERLP
jgi:hypothetical protein